MYNKESLSELLEKEDGTEKMINDCLEFIKKADEVVIFGAGVGGDALYNLLKKRHLEEKIVYFSDNNILKHGTFLGKKEVVAPEKLIDICDKVSIVIASSAYNEIKQQLLNYGYTEEKIALFNFAFSDLDYTDKQFIFDNLDDFEWIFHKLSDKKSERIFLDLLNYKISKNNEYLEDMAEVTDCESEQYFDKEIIKLSQDECFVDVGSYTGDTLKQYVQIVNEEFASYIGFESDEGTFQILKTYSDSLKSDKVHIYNLGAWNKRTRLTTESNNSSYGSFSFMECTDEEGIEADALDNVIGTENVTFIKMDIEGAEYFALEGLVQTIKRCLPKLAICVYHKRDDYFKIPQLIEKIAEGKYDYYFRQYRYTPTETVCYAIPKSKI